MADTPTGALLAAALDSPVAQLLRDEGTPLTDRTPSLTRVVRHEPFHRLQVVWREAIDASFPALTTTCDAKTSIYVVPGWALGAFDRAATMAGPPMRIGDGLTLDDYVSTLPGIDRTPLADRLGGDNSIADSLVGTARQLGVDADRRIAPVTWARCAGMWCTDGYFTAGDAAQINDMVADARAAGIGVCDWVAAAVSVAASVGNRDYDGGVIAALVA